MCCLAAAKQETSDARESATIEVLTACPLQETALGESYLQLVEKYLLKHSIKVYKNQPKDNSLKNQALFWMKTSTSVLETTGSL